MTGCTIRPALARFPRPRTAPRSRWWERGSPGSWRPTSSWNSGSAPSSTSPPASAAGCAHTSSRAPTGSSPNSAGCGSRFLARPSSTTPTRSGSPPRRSPTPSPRPGAAGVGLAGAPCPNPLTEAAGSTVIDIAGETFRGRTLSELPPEFAEVAVAWEEALEQIGFGALQDAIRARDIDTLKKRWNELVPLWDGRTFYDFVATSACFSKLPFRYREMFGLVPFGTGGWAPDFPNSMREILRVVITNCDTDQRLIVGGAERLPRGLWTLPVSERSPWPAGTTLESLHGGVPRPGGAGIRRRGGGFVLRDRWGTERIHDAVLATCQGWLLTTQIELDENIFSQDLWMALDRPRDMQPSTTFVVVD